MTRLQHVALTFPPGGEADLRAFYAGLIGLEEMPVPPEVADRGWIWFATREAGVEVHFVPDERPPDATRLHHMCLEVEALDPVLARIEGAGHAAWEARSAIGGRRRWFSRDPFGNLVELAELETPGG